MVQLLRNHLMHVWVAFVVIFALAGCQSMTGETAGENLDDSKVTAAVKTNLAKERFGTLTNIEVDTVRNTVYLTGVVESQEWKDRAGQVAKNTGGVKKVINNLQVRSAAAPSSGSSLLASWSIKRQARAPTRWRWQRIRMTNEKTMTLTEVGTWRER